MNVLFYYIDEQRALLYRLYAPKELYYTDYMLPKTFSVKRTWQRLFYEEAILISTARMQYFYTKLNMISDPSLLVLLLSSLFFAPIPQL